MYLGNTLIPDGNPLKLGNTQVNKIMLGDSQVWISSSPPSEITDFEASEGLVDIITVTFSPASGMPVPTYNLIDDGSDAVLAEGISSGYSLDWTTWGVNLRVDAVNSMSTTSSNVEYGESRAPANEVEYTSGSGTFTVPYGIYSLSVCMIGGGNGTQTYVGEDGLGGEAGDIWEGNISVTPDQDIDYSVGGSGSWDHGGGETSFGSEEAAGGNARDNYTGDRTNCMGTFTCYGYGEAGFSDTTNGENSTRGSGAPHADGPDFYHGGVGVVNITY